MKAITLAPARSQHAYFGLLLFFITLMIAPWVAGEAGGNAWVRALDFTLLYIILALGLNIVVGYAGLLDLGFIGFYALGAYVAALLTSPHLAIHLPSLAAIFPNNSDIQSWVVLFAAGLFSGFFGIVLGIPLLRLRGDYLAIVTLGIGEIIRIVLRNLDRPVNITNGAQGIGLVEPIRIAHLDFSRSHELFGHKVSSPYLYYYLFVVLTLLTMFACVRMQKSRIGRAWQAIRENEEAARALGLNILSLKLLAFAVGAMFGGMSGALFAMFQGFVSPESFSLNESVAVLAMIVLGGMGHVRGIVLGCFLLGMFPELLRTWSVWFQQKLFGETILEPEIIRQLLLGTALIVMMNFRPQGLLPAKGQYT